MQIHCLRAGLGRRSNNEFWLYGTKGTLHLDPDAKKLNIAQQDNGELSVLPMDWKCCPLLMRPSCSLITYTSIRLQPNPSMGQAQSVGTDQVPACGA